jgi:hypothetical protein
LRFGCIALPASHRFVGIADCAASIAGAIAEAYWIDVSMMSTIALCRS